MRQTLRIRPLLATAAALALIPLAGIASEPAQPPAPAAAAPAAAPAAETPAATSSGLDALKKGVNPKTGEVEAVSPADDAYLSQQTKAALDKFPHRSPKKIKGSVDSLFAAPHGIAVAVAKVGADGKLTWDCDKSVEGALAKIEAQRAQQAASQQEEK